MREHYQTIAKKLMAELEGRGLSVGDALPTRQELAARFNVARATIDRAVTLLIKRGLLDASRGSGTFIAKEERNYKVALLGGFGFEELAKINVKARRSLTNIPYERIASRSERCKLTDYDGLAWICPEEPQLEWLKEFAGKIPQIIINRHLDEFDYISTNHQGAIETITAERIAAWPDALPVYLDHGKPGLVWGMRRKGFNEACRLAAKQGEILIVPEKFEELLKTLEKRFGRKMQQRLILVSGTEGTTGATMLWARLSGLQWGRDLRYSDFDNNHPTHVWGVKVTSFVQDWAMLFNGAVESLESLISQKETSVKRLVMPQRIMGET